MAKRNIADYKNRMSAPIGAVQVDPKTGKPISKKKKSSSRRK